MLVRADLFSSVFRPAIPGCAVATPGRPAGTLGCVVRDPLPGGAFYVLSAAHVIGNHTFDPLGLPVLQPGTMTTPDQLIGQVSRWGALEFTQDTYPNLFDAAIARVAQAAVVPDILDIGRPRGINHSVPEGMPVRKSGAASRVTHGVVLDVNFHCDFTYEDSSHGLHRAGFQQQLLCGRAPGTDVPFSRTGDSGAVVVDDSNMIVGLIVGSVNGGTVVSPIAPVLQALKVAIA
jgi:hypothetical protein